MPQTLKPAIDDLLLKTLNCRNVNEQDPSWNALSMVIQPRDLPALSAWLLEYPVGYTFSADPAIQQTETRYDTAGTIRGRAERTNLDGEPLVLVKVTLVGNRELGKR